ncbi:TBC1 domain family member 10A-like [Venturia canescens]|uniref:TBC1 domain family member 10A-like n=1 Tax=Venturia canescens TaxID=32260 RepID=UPI001C9CC774|nr:TBC1 domain family member 10A-like [Venturia canescens]
MASALDHSEEQGDLQDAESEASDREELVELQHREEEWQRMLDDWAVVEINEDERIKELCRVGIPPKVRPRAWFYLSQGHSLLLEQRALYRQLVQASADRYIMKEIDADINLQFADHQWFGTHAPRRQELFSVLKAYHGLKGVYCRAQGQLASVLLMHMPELQAFWSFVAISKYRLFDWKDKGRRMLLEHEQVTVTLLRKISPVAYEHLTRLGIDPKIYLNEWFSNLYAHTLPWESLLRVWDMFLCDGNEAIFKVALVLIKNCLGNTSLTQRCPTMYHVLEILRRPPYNVVEETALMSEVREMDLGDQLRKYELMKRSLKRPSEASGSGIQTKREKAKEGE